MKAKRSLTSSFDQLLKRKPSKDEFGIGNKEYAIPIKPAAITKVIIKSGYRVVMNGLSYRNIFSYRSIVCSLPHHR